MKQQVLFWNGIAFAVTDNATLTLTPNEAGTGLKCHIDCEITGDITLLDAASVITDNSRVPDGKIVLDLASYVGGSGSIGNTGSTGYMSSDGSAAALKMNFSFHVRGHKKDLGN